ncbi:AEC family transporter [Dongshaea marina]|uniref:AEC family transporter n=1 Tax=Dongshaea marina TaxID=2047966 RepID=UPI001F3D2C42|nr:AEC family transporter [Dongshaea marina]
MSDLGASALFALSITFPICFLLLFGAWLKRIQLINDAFSDTASQLVFKITLPLLLFSSVMKTDLKQQLHWPLLLFAVVATLFLFVGLEWMAGRWIALRELRGIFVQGGYRGNLAIIGLAYIYNAYGGAGLSQAAPLVALLVVTYNILAVLTLSRSLTNTMDLTWRSLLRSIALNPLILGIVAGFIGLVSGLVLPRFILQTISYLTNISLPIALLCAGSSLSLGDFVSSRIFRCGRPCVSWYWYHWCWWWGLICSEPEVLCLGSSFCWAQHRQQRQAT